jgi:hypothetical protein
MAALGTCPVLALLGWSVNSCSGGGDHTDALCRGTPNWVAIPATANTARNRCAVIDNCLSVNPGSRPRNGPVAVRRGDGPTWHNAGMAAEAWATLTSLGGVAIGGGG